VYCAVISGQVLLPLHQCCYCVELLLQVECWVDSTGSPRTHRQTYGHTDRSTCDSLWRPMQTSLHRLHDYITAGSPRCPWCTGLSVCPQFARYLVPCPYIYNVPGLMSLVHCVFLLSSLRSRFFSISDNLFSCPNSLKTILLFSSCKLSLICWLPFSHTSSIRSSSHSHGLIASFWYRRCSTVSKQLPRVDSLEDLAQLLKVFVFPVDLQGGLQLVPSSQMCTVDLQCFQ